MIGILVSLILLIALAYRGVSVIILAPVLAVLAVVLNEGGPILGTYTQVFLPALGDYLVRFFPLFLLGAIFGRLMQDSGSADAIAKWIVGIFGPQQANLAVVLACAVLTYGGVSLFVVAFAIYPIAASLFVAANQPKRLIPAAIALGAFTFTMTALPGSPQIQNAIPAPYFGTDSFAAPLSGLLAAVIIFSFGMWWLQRRARSDWAAAEGYGEDDAFVQSPQREDEVDALPPVWIAALPVILVIVLNLLTARVFLPAFDTSYLTEAAYGSTTLDAVRGVWSLVVALTIASISVVLLNLRRLSDLNQRLKDGVAASFLPIFNTASEVGYGTVIASLAAFVVLRDALVQIAPNNPLISEAIAVNILAGVTGSASGGG